MIANGKLPTQEEFQDWYDNLDRRLYRIKEAIAKSKELGRPLTNEEFDKFLVSEKPSLNHDSEGDVNHDGQRNAE